MEFTVNVSFMTESVSRSLKLKSSIKRSARK